MNIKELVNSIFIRKPAARLLLKRPLTKRAGPNTSYNLLMYSSIECAAWARIRHRKIARSRTLIRAMVHLTPHPPRRPQV